MKTIIMLCLLSFIPAQAIGQVISGPFLHGLQSDRVTLCFESIEKSSYTVIYGTDELDKEWTDSMGANYHCAQLTGLEPGRTYYYRITQEPLVKLPVMKFNTPPADETELRFAVYGDTRTGHDLHRQAASLLNQLDPDFVLHTGDWVDDGDDHDAWTTFFDITHGLFSRLPVVPVIGNHDNREGTLYDTYFPMATHEDGTPRRYYVYRRADVLFLIIDSECNYEPGSDQYLWIEDQLASAKDDPEIHHIIASFHRPPVSSSWHAGEDSRPMEMLHPLLAEGGVKLVFNGHDHNYERSLVDGVTYVVAGGGGAPTLLPDENVPPKPEMNPHSQAFAGIIHACLVETRDDCLKVRMYDTAMRVRDEASIGQCQEAPVPDTVSATDAIAGDLVANPTDCPAAPAGSCAHGGSESSGQLWLILSFLISGLFLRRKLRNN